MAIEPCTDLRDFFRRQLTTAFTRRRLDARPETRDYIAGVLVDYGHHPPALSAPLVVSLSEALSTAAPARLPLLLRTGDAALCLAGLFAPHVERTQGSLELYVHVGSVAYRHAAEASRHSDGEVPAAALEELGGAFPRFVDALQEVAESSASWVRHAGPGAALRPDEVRGLGAGRGGDGPPGGLSRPGDHRAVLNLSRSGASARR